MKLLYYLLYLWACWVALMLVFRLTTYHRHFLAALPLLVGVSALAGFLFRYFRFDSLFLPHLVVIIILLTLSGFKSAKEGEALLESLPNDIEVADVKFVAKSVANTRRFYVLSSMIHVIIFSVVYLYALNSGLSSTS